MNHEIDISQFSEKPSLFEGLSLLATIKSMDLGAIQKRYLQSQQNKNHKAGSKTRRAPALGAITLYHFSTNSIPDYRILTKCKEPRGIDTFKDQLAYSSDKTVFISTPDIQKKLNHPWFSYIHTVKWNPYHPYELLISSSGYDSIFIYNIIKEEFTFEWFAWENGFEYGSDPETGDKVRISRNPETVKNESCKVFLINPFEGTYLPTAMRTAFINTADFGRNSAELILTLFHNGTVISIDRNTGLHKVIASDLSKPHGAYKRDLDLLVTSTSSGHVRLNDQLYSFTHFPTVNPNLSGKEWLQNSVLLTRNKVITIDSNRHRFTIFDIREKTIAHQEYNSNYAIQDVCLIEPSLFKLLPKYINQE